MVALVTSINNFIRALIGKNISTWQSESYYRTWQCDNDNRKLYKYVCRR